MKVATCVIQLSLEGVFSLKDKRRIVKSILARLPQHFNVAAAEVDHHDTWHIAGIGLAAIGTDAGYLHGLLEKAVTWIETTRPDVPVIDYEIEIF
ncbi:MAG: DUF503 family protein [Anaerolineae bacterium]|nr:DUF503 family protein [Anaerolineae bacterium]